MEGAPNTMSAPSEKIMKADSPKSVFCLHELFAEISGLIRDAPVTPEIQVSDANKLRMYGLYKQATVGGCNTDLAPSRLQVVARAKHQAWADCQGMSSEKAMLEYVELAASESHWLGRACRSKLQEWRTTRQASGIQSSKSTPAVLVSPADDTEEESNNEHSTTSFVNAKSEPVTIDNSRLPSRMYLWLEQTLGIRPLIPRGQLDISYRDLGFAAWQCLCSSNNMERYCQLEHEVASLWGSSNDDHATVIAGLSVRSLLDLYLRTTSFPVDSEVIVTPPINIPGMMDVLQHHKMKIIPVDVPHGRDDRQYMVSINVDAIKERITDKTVAIMIVHPFGMLSTNDQHMMELRELATAHKLHLLEDCAECFTGLGDDCYKGSPAMDISLFSFGTIKTATALGGGLAIVPAKPVADKMIRMHHSLYQQQTQVEYLIRVLWSVIMRFIADHALLYGVLFFIVSSMGLDFDAIVSRSVRSFAPAGSDSKRSKRRTMKSVVESESPRLCLSQLQKRPSAALLSLLIRRLGQCRHIARSVTARIEQCQYMTTMLDDVATRVSYPKPLSDSVNSYWLFPVHVAASDNVSHRLLSKGFDIPRGLSQLKCISRYASTVTSCDRTDEFMNGVLYLPVASHRMTKREMHRLALALNAATEEFSNGTSAEKHRVCMDCETLRKARTRLARSRSLPFAIMTFILFIFTFYPSILLSGLVCGVWIVLQIWAAVLVAGMFAAVAMRWTMADFYLKSSQGFSKYSSMLFEPSQRDLASSDKESAKSPPAGKAQDDYPMTLLGLDCLRIPEAMSTNTKQMVLLTGATGFIGRLLLRDLLLHRERLGIERGVLVICRPKRGRSALDRIADLLDDSMYSFLSNEEKRDLVRVYEGNVTKADAGLSPNDRKEICTKLDISHVIHCAATVSFTQTLREAAISNISSSLNLQSLTGRLKSKSAKYVHLSTAFVHGEQTGTAYNPLPEELFSLDGYDAVEVFRSMLSTEYYAASAMSDLRFPNTYTFSKSICEHLLSRDTSVPTIVIRPSIVGPSVHQPYEGWAGDKPTTIVAAACLYMTYQWNLWCFGNHRVPFIPVDVVSTFIVCKSFQEGDAGDSPRRTCESPTTCSSEDDFERVSLSCDLSSPSSERSEPSPSSSPAIKCSLNENYAVYNLAWDASSPDSTSFTWIDYAVTVTHIGAFFGLFSRLTAYIGLFTAVRILPGMRLNTETFQSLHRVLVQFPIDTIIYLFTLLGLFPQWIAQLSKLSSFTDLPLLFFPFMNASFHFTSDLVAPTVFDGKRYLFSCGVAAKRFVDLIRFCRGNNGDRLIADKTASPALTIGGALHKPPCDDLFWALTQPQGNVFVRVAGWVFRKIIRVCSVAVTVDAESFSKLMPRGMNGGKRPVLVLAPTHRSFFDFLLVSYVCFSLPELGIQIPYIAAADDFEQLWVFGWFAAHAKVFFLRRGRGKADPSLAGTLNTLTASSGDQGVCIEVFVEGGRSRDRRFLRPKTGLLRCLAESGQNYVLVPLTINYEKIPEQSTLSNQTEHGFRTRLTSDGLTGWLKRVFSGAIDIGRIHITAASPIEVDDPSQTDVRATTIEIQRRQQALVTVSSYHICAASKALGLPLDVTHRALTAAGCRFWPSLACSTQCPTCWTTPESPTATSEQWTTLLQFGHVLATFFEASHPNWCKWLNVTGSMSCYMPASLDQLPLDLRALVGALGNFFDTADDSVDDAITKLRANGFDCPAGEHIVQTVMRDVREFPWLLIRAAVSFRLGEIDDYTNRQVSFGSRDDHEDVMTVLGTIAEYDEHESLGFWGFRDSGFVLQLGRKDCIAVAMTGTRYGISGKRLTKLVPFIENETKTRIDLFDDSAFRPSPVPSLECDLSREDLKSLGSVVTKVSTSSFDRVRHGSGHSQEEVYLIRSGAIGKIRLPDAVAWPSSENEVEALVAMAKSSEWCLIPFGGGTNVSHSVRCPAKEIEPRPIISVDMKLMSRILWVNEEDGLANIEAGITGRALVEEMRHRGYTIGHEPDSIEFSTLGGWIATKASGMKRNKYGNIEDIVKSVRVVGSEGVLWRGKQKVESTTNGRESRGVDLVSLTIGSEGCFGIVTSAVIRIWLFPERQEYDSIIFADFRHGLRFCRDVARLGPNAPSSVRLLDNEHFRLGQALGGDACLVERGLTYLWKTIHGFRSISPESLVCATIVFEGSSQEVESQRRVLRCLVSQHGGTVAGSRIGRSGYELTFAIAYLRDFAMTYNFLAESFETFCPWSKVDSIIQAVKDRIKREHQIRSLPGEPFVGSRLTQLYHEGACLYFYFCMSIKGVKSPSSIFSEIEHAARQEILEQGGSLSHHHGIGKIRADFNRQMDSDPFRDVLCSLKKSIDPSNTFGARNGVLHGSD